MQKGGNDFARASNFRSFGVYGDPERWQSSQVIRVVPGEPPNPSPQLIRVQCAELWSTTWDLICTWNQLSGPQYDPAANLLVIEIELTIGMGQSTQRVSWVPIRENVKTGPQLGLTSGSANPGDPFSGCSLVSLPAGSINARVTMGMMGEPADPGDFSFSLGVAPRVMVPE